MDSFSKEPENCCIRPSSCKTYNRIGLFCFVLWIILQIISVSTPWVYFKLSRTDLQGNRDQIEAKFYSTLVDIIHSKVNYGQDKIPTSATASCNYDGKAQSDLQNSILTSLNSTCPSTAHLGDIYPIVLGTSIAAIISEILMATWLYYRTFDSGIKALFEKKCCTQAISMFLTIIIIATSTVPFALLADRSDYSLLMDFGDSLFKNYGCEAYGQHIYCFRYYTSYNYDCPKGFTCDSTKEFSTGFILSFTNMILLTISCLYTWIGSWCCPCCCCMEEEIEATVTTTSTSPIFHTYATPIYGTIVTNQYTLFVHHGASLPTKMFVTANSLGELEAGIAANLGISSPFKVALFDEMVKQYVLVTDIAVIPYQATVQVIYN